MIAYHIAYLSKKRVVVIPRDPNRLLAIQQIFLSIEKFKLNYIVISELWKTESMAYPAIDFIKENFNLIKIIESEDTYYVYAVFASQSE